MVFIHKSKGSLKCFGMNYPPKMNLVKRFILACSFGAVGHWVPLSIWSLMLVSSCEMWNWGSGRISRAAMEEGDGESI